jgi:TIR domain
MSDTSINAMVQNGAVGVAGAQVVRIENLYVGSLASGVAPPIGRSGDSGAPFAVPNKLQWYVSYAWADESDPTREKKVDELCDAAKRRNVAIIRDKTTLSRGDRISEFMQKIGEGDRVFIFLSDKYLHSPYCMFELFEIWRNSRQDKARFLSHVRFFTVDGAKIGKTDEWLNYTEFWQRERDQLRQAIDRVGWRDAGEEATRRYRNMETFAGEVSNILALFADVVQARTFDDFLRYGFDDPPENQEESVLRNPDAISQAHPSLAATAAPFPRGFEAVQRRSAPTIFLSHSGCDTEAARELKRRLLGSPDAQKAGLRVWFDKDDLEAGRRWSEQISEAIEKQATAFVVYFGSGGVINWVEAEVDLALSRASADKSFPFIPVLAAESAGVRALPPFTRAYQGVSDPLGNTGEFRKLLAAVLGLRAEALNSPEELDLLLDPKTAANSFKPSIEPKLDEQAILDLTKVIEAAFKVKELDQLINLTFSENLYKIYVPKYVKGEYNTLALLAELLNRGIVAQFLRALRKARPNNVALLQTIGTRCPIAMEMAPVDSESLEVITKGLIVVKSLLKDPTTSEDVHGLISRNRTELRQLEHGLERLRAYKTLHDALQKVQMDHYQLLDAQTKKLREDPSAVESLGREIRTIRRLCLESENGAKVLKSTQADFDEEMKWVETLTAAVDTLESAVDKLDDFAARSVVKEIRDVIRYQPPRVNSQLRKSAESLPIANLILTIIAVKSVPNLHAQKQEALDSAKAKLESLWADVRGRVAAHNCWQDVEAALWGADDEFERDLPALNDFKIYWRAANQKIQPLWDLDPLAGWVRKTRPRGEATDAALAMTPIDLPLVKRCYNKFREETLDQFFIVDNNLKTFCENILDLTKPLNAILIGLPE